MRFCFACRPVAARRAKLRKLEKEMTGDEIKALRRALDVTARKLGAAIGVGQATVLALEREELFPTKRPCGAGL